MPTPEGNYLHCPRVPICQAPASSFARYTQKGKHQKRNKRKEWVGIHNTRARPHKKGGVARKQFNSKFPRGSSAAISYNLQIGFHRDKRSRFAQIPSEGFLVALVKTEFPDYTAGQLRTLVPAADGEPSCPTTTDSRSVSRTKAFPQFWFGQQTRKRTL